MHRHTQYPCIHMYERTCMIHVLYNISYAHIYIYTCAFIYTYMHVYIMGIYNPMTRPSILWLILGSKSPTMVLKWF